MISSISSTISFLCINLFMKNHTFGENYAVIINSDSKYDVPTIRINSKHFELSGKLFQRPKFYIIDLDRFKVQQLMLFSRYFGHTNQTKYFLSGNETALQNFHQRIYSNGNGCPKNEEMKNFVVLSETDVFENKKKITVCIFLGSPIAFYKNGELTGIVIEFWRIVFDLLKIEGEFLTMEFPKGRGIFIIDAFLVNGSCDIFSSSNAMDGFYDSSHAHYFDSLHWVVRTAKEIPRWKYAFEIYSKETWGIWFSAAAALSAAQFTLSKIQEKKVKWTDGLVMIFFSFMQQSQRMKPSSLSQYILLNTLILTTFLMNLFYCTKFAFLLTGLKYEPSVDTFEDIMEEGYNLKFSRAMMVFFQDPKTFNYIKDHYEESKLTYNISGNYATMLLRTSFDFEIGNFLDDEKRPLIRMLNEAVVSIPFVSILLKDSYLTDKLNEKFDSLFQNGIFDNIRRKYVTHKMDKVSSIHVKKLTLNSVQLAFILWAIGVVLSSIRFYFEVENK